MPELPIALGIVGALLLITFLLYILACRRENRPDRILGLLYHRLLTREEYDRVEPPSEKVFAMPEGRFREQMHYLADQGFHPVTLAAVLGYLENGSPLPSRPVLITFDDGCVSVHARALPILRDHAFPAVCFVTTDPRSRIFHQGNMPQRRLTEQEIRDLDAGGVTIGSHGVTHGALETMPVEEIDRELRRSRQYLEGVLDKPVHALGVPLGWYGKKVRDSARRTGYRTVLTSDDGIIHRGTDPFHLRRFTIEGTSGVDDFARSLEAVSIARRRLVKYLKRLPARLVGPRLWMPLRAALLASPLRILFSLRVLQVVALVVVFLMVLLVGVVAFLLIRAG